jgi:probable F420-dependent oxidoreductase
VQLGVTFPQTEIGTDIAVLRDYVRTAESSGYTFLTAFDHVLGADAIARSDWEGHYDHTDAFHEPFVLFGWLAGISSLELMTGVLILPQRQTVLVAKQAAEVDVLTGGRLRLGVGVGWNEVEYLGLGMPFHQRGQRLEEQVSLLRRLWTEPTLSFSGRFDAVDRAGILPQPIQQPIPIWMGSLPGNRRVWERIGRLSDGWISVVQPGPLLEEALATVHKAAEDAGRDPASVGLQTQISVPADYNIDLIRRERDAGREIGASHVNIDTMRAGRSPQQHIDLIGQLGTLLTES